MSIVAVLLSSCGVSASYIPQQPPVPLIDHRGEMQLSATFNEVGMSNATLSVGLTNWLAAQVHVSGQIINVTPGAGSAAVGVYRHFGPLVAEAYYGWELGTATNRTPLFTIAEFTRHINGSYAMPYLQLNCGLRDVTPLHIDCGVALRGAIMRPSFKITTDDYFEGGNNSDTRYYNTITKILEPQLFLRFGGENIKWHMQAGWCFPYSSTVDANDFDRFNMTVGVTFILN